MKKTILGLFFLFSFTCFSQDNKDYSLLNQGKITFNFFTLEGSYELSLNNKISLETGIGIGAGSFIRNILFVGETLQINYNTFPVLKFRGKLKYVYNREKRLHKNKNIDFNSGNYIAIQSIFSSKKNDVADNIIFNEVHWGIQRSLGGKWLLNVNGGIGYAKDLDTNLDGIYPSVNLEFSYVIF